MLGRQSFATVLVGKSVLLREGIAKILRSAKTFRVLASVSCIDSVLAGKLQPHRQPLFIVVHTGDDFDTALKQIELLADQHPAGRIVVVADRRRPRELVSAFRAGANGYFVDMTCDAFIKSLELVVMGETIFPPVFPSSVLDIKHEPPREARPAEENDEAIFFATEDPLAPPLSSREKSILGCLIQGDSNKCIARKMDIAEATVKVHVKAILRKIRVQNRTQAAIWGANNRSLTRTPPPSVSDASKLSPKPVVMLSEIDQAASPEPAGLIPEANQVDASRIGHVLRKGINRGTHGAARLDK